MINLETLAMKYNGEQILLLDQQKLPHMEDWVDATSPDAMVECIRHLKVRGAPMIGVAAAVCLLHLVKEGCDADAFKAEALKLRESRPTAVNLMIAVDRLLKLEFNSEKIISEAIKIFNEDVELCKKIASYGADFIEDGDSILTHCNTGGLATAGVGTALGVIRKAHEQGKSIHVYVDETRPLLQGGRLTTWELEKLNIPYTLICDNMAATIMSQGRIQKAIVGADRIALNGDFANKIGTYNVALLCYYHRIPFYVAAPETTIDKSIERGNEIPIEQRSHLEVKGVAGSFGEVRWAPENANAYNPAFDVTPAEFVTGWILDKGAFTKKEIDQGILKYTQSD